MGFLWRTLLLMHLRFATPEQELCNLVSTINDQKLLSSTFYFWPSVLCDKLVSNPSSSRSAPQS
jgi:hypothetical protein